MNIGVRLREERERLGYTQDAFAALANSGKRTLIGWEQGRSSPDAAVLAALATHAVDVMYVVTGKRSGEIDANLLGLCESALRQAYVAARPQAKAIGAVRSNALGKTYNTLIGKLASSDADTAAHAAAAEYIALLDDPADPALLARALFGTVEDIPAPRGHQVQADKSSIAAVGDVTIGSFSGRRKK